MIKVLELKNWTIWSNFFYCSLAEAGTNATKLTASVSILNQASSTNASNGTLSLGDVKVTQGVRASKAGSSANGAIAFKAIKALVVATGTKSSASQIASMKTSCGNPVGLRSKSISISRKPQNPNEEWTPAEHDEESDDGEIKLVEKFSQESLSDYFRDMDLTKQKSELSVSRNLLLPGVKITVYRDREHEFAPYFAQEPDFVYCCDIEGLMHQLGHPGTFKPEAWRLFIDGSNKSLKFVLLHNGNKLGSVPMAYSWTLKERADAIKKNLEKLQYSKYLFLICADLKLVAILLGLQTGFTKFPCFICLWDSRARHLHYQKTTWPIRDKLVIGMHNVKEVAMVPRDRIIFPFLHIKLGLMKQWTKALDREGGCFNFMVGAFPELSYEKIKAGVFTGPQIRKLVNDPNFTATMTEVERKSWEAFVDVQRNLLGSHKSPDFVQKVEALISNFTSKNQFLVWQCNRY